MRPKHFYHFCLLREELFILLTIFNSRNFLHFEIFNWFETM